MQLSPLNLSSIFATSRTTLINRKNRYSFARRCSYRDTQSPARCFQERKYTPRLQNHCLLSNLLSSHACPLSCITAKPRLALTGQPKHRLEAKAQAGRHLPKLHRGASCTKAQAARLICGQAAPVGTNSLPMAPQLRHLSWASLHQLCVSRISVLHARRARDVVNLHLATVSSVPRIH